MFEKLTRLILPTATFVLILQTAHADIVRVATWNVTNYGGGRDADFKTCLYGVFEGRSMSPDVLIGQEFISQAGVNAYLAILNTAPGSPGDWQAAAFYDGPDTDSAFFYRFPKVQLCTDLSPNGVTTIGYGGSDPLPPRDMRRYDIVLAPGTSEEARVAIYSAHMKSGSAGTDQSRRYAEAVIIRDDTETLPAGWHFVIGGDFNVQTSSQAAYVELVGSQTNNAGRFWDPIKTPGSWNNNGSFRFVHTQDPIGAGGMDDRHDQLLLSISLIDGAGLDYLGDPNIPYSTTTWNDLNHSYRSWGNDGTSFNLALTVAGNTMVGPTIAQALRNAANGQGHLPVILDLVVPPCPGDIECNGVIDVNDLNAFGDCMSGPADGDEYVVPTQHCQDYFDLESDVDTDVADYSQLQLSAGL